MNHDELFIPAFHCSMRLPGIRIIKTGKILIDRI